jgi:hypothetical protein
MSSNPDPQNMGVLFWITPDYEIVVVNGEAD